MAIDTRFTNGFRAMKALEKAALDSRVEEIEGAGMDEGRVFIHLKKGFIFGAGEGAHLKSVGSKAELESTLRTIEPCTCEQCTPAEVL